jgi:simple sugar transport system ATP-binding protein
VSILTGLLQPDSGRVEFGGEPSPPVYQRDAWRSKVACVYQRSTVIPALSIAENLFLNRQPSRRAVIGWRTLRSEAQRLVDEWDIGVDVADLADVLSVEQRQMVEIARALSFGTKFIILDEPTAQLDGRGIERLFDRLRALRAGGISCLFISHHLAEIFEICQTVTVLRDARLVLTAPVAAMSSAELVAAMTGETDLAHVVSATSTARPGTPALEVEHLTSPGSFEDVTLRVQAGEVVGITGNGSSGRIAFAETIVGLRTARAGRISVAGTPLTPGSVPSALHAGVGFVPRDRHHQGLVELLSVAENLTMTVPDRLGRWGMINPRQRDKIAAESIEALSIHTSGPDQPVGSLSGGNQQKVVMGRALANTPKLLLLMHPTAGVDVRSKATLLSVVDTVREEGTGVLIVSDELDDLRTCDRVLVMLVGKVSAEFVRGWADKEIVAASEGVADTDAR